MEDVEAIEMKQMEYAEWCRSVGITVQMIEAAMKEETCPRCGGGGDCQCIDCGDIHSCAKCFGTGKIEVDVYRQQYEECRERDRWLAEQFMQSKTTFIAKETEGGVNEKHIAPNGIP